MYNLFLDDYRIPLDCAMYMHKRIAQDNLLYMEEPWECVRNYDEFVETIQKKGLPKLISFDHDLADEHYAPEHEWDNYDDWAERSNFKEKTGYDCAKYLLEFCKERNLQIPRFFVHSMNPVGTQNITNILKQ